VDRRRVALELTPYAYANSNPNVFIDPTGQYVLNQELFVDEPDAQRKAERWRQHYNEERPHSALSNRTPAEFGREARGLRPRTPAD
jgi:transposase InsO family protein